MRQRWNQSGELVKLVSELSSVLDRPLSISVRSPRQLQRRLLPSQITELVAVYKGGEEIQDLAARYGVHRTTVANLLRKNLVELRRQGITDLALPEVIRLYVADGWSCQKLAQSFDCDAETVRQALKRAGVRLRKPWERF